MATYVAWNVEKGYESFQNLRQALKQCAKTNCRVIFGPHHESSFIRKGNTDAWREIDANGQCIGEFSFSLRRQVAPRQHDEPGFEAIDPSLEPVDRVGLKHCLTRSTKCQSQRTRASALRAGT